MTEPPSLTPTPRPLAEVFRTQAAAVAKLAVPVMFARAGMLVMAFVATAFVGHAGAQELAYFAIGSAPQQMLMTLGIGLMLGTGVLAAQAKGADRPAEAGGVWRVAMLIGVVYGLGAGAVNAVGEPLLAAFGQPPDLARGGGHVLVMYAIGMPVAVLFIGTSLFLEGIGKPRVGMLIVFGGNVVNLVACWALVEGNLGMPAMGAAGAALAFSVARWFMVVAIVAYVLLMKDAARYGVARRLAGTARLAKRLLAIGAPMGIALGLESACFATVAGFAGILGTVPIAAYQVFANVIALVYMLSVGIGTATAVHTAQAMGRRDHRAAAMTGWAGFALVLATTGTVGLILWLSADLVAGAYTSDPVLLPVAAAAVALSGLFVVADGGQGVLIGALRGIGDVIAPTFVYFVAFWVIAVPLAYVLGVEAGHGLDALLGALGVGLVVAMISFAFRFHQKTRPRLVAA